MQEGIPRPITGVRVSASRLRGDEETLEGCLKACARTVGFLLTTQWILVLNFSVLGSTPRWVEGSASLASSGKILVDSILSTSFRCLTS